MWYNEGPIGYVPQGYVPPRHSYTPQQSWGSPFGFEADPRQDERNRRRRAQELEQQQMAREQEQLRRRQAAEHRHRRQHAQAQTAKMERNRRVGARLRYIAASIAARKIQRWWRTVSATQKIAAAQVVLVALRRNAARARRRAVAASLRQLRDLEAAIEAVPAVTLAEAGGSDKTSTRARLVFEHTLETLVLSADNIPTRGSETARAFRKRLVLRANARLQAYDELTQKARGKAVAAQAASEDSSTDVEMCSDGEADVDSGAAGEPVTRMEDELDGDTSSKSLDTPGAAVAAASSEARLQQACQRFVSELANLETTEGTSGHFHKTLKTLQGAVSAAQHRLLVATSTV